MEETNLHQHLERKPKILYVTAASPYNTTDSNDTMEVILEMFKQRTNTEKDIWLFGIDVSGKENESQNKYEHFSSPYKSCIPHILDIIFSLESLFRGVHLDLDDDVVIYEVNTKESPSYYRLHEVYKIKKGGDPIIRHVGSWAKAGRSYSSFDFTKEDKNWRRKDLRVSIL